MTSVEKAARVVDVLDEKYVVLNVGADQGVKLGDTFVVYSRDREIKDINGESLGFLEVAKGYGSVTSVQQVICILKADYATGFHAESSDTSYLAKALMPPDILGSRKEEFLRVTRGDFARKT